MITVMDAPCGAGKSTWAIKYINSNPQVNFIVITPFLKEVETNYGQTKNANNYGYKNSTNKRDTSEAKKSTFQQWRANENMIKH